MLLLSLVLAAPTHAGTVDVALITPEVRAEIDREGHAIIVQPQGDADAIVTGAAVVFAPAADVYAALTDFPSYPEWVPGLNAASVVSTDGPTSVVDMDSTMTIGPLKRRQEFKIAYTADKPDELLSFTIVEGDVRADGGWTLVPIADGETLVMYSSQAKMETLGWGPKLLLSAVPDAGTNVQSNTALNNVWAIKARLGPQPL